VKKLYKKYQSLAGVGAALGISRQAVLKKIKYNGYEIIPGKKRIVKIQEKMKTEEANDE